MSDCYNSNTNHCGGCKYTDGLCYTSNPPKVKCTITGDFHYYDDECNCRQIITPIHDAIKYFKEKLFIADERSNHEAVLAANAEYRLPSKPTDIKSAGAHIIVGKCPKCKELVNNNQNYCDKCGKALLWPAGESETSQIIRLLNEARQDLETAKVKELHLRQNLQNAVNILDITEDTEPSLKSAYDLAVKLLEKD